MAKFKVGDKVEDFERGAGTIVSHDDTSLYSDGYDLKVLFDREYSDYYTNDGRRFSNYRPTLRLTGRPFNVGDRVVIGGNRGVVDDVQIDAVTTFRVSLIRDYKKDVIWLTHDGRAWPGTPIICEHDWWEESETGKNKTENHAADAIEYRERNKGVDISPGFAKDWPIDNGIEDITVSDAEVQHIAEMQNWRDVARKQDTELIKEQHNYVRMALKLTGFELDKEAAAIITETVKKVLELGGEFSLKTACEVEARVNQMYDETNI